MNSRGNSPCFCNLVRSPSIFPSSNTFRTGICCLGAFWPPVDAGLSLGVVGVNGGVSVDEGLRGDKCEAFGLIEVFTARGIGGSLLDMMDWKDGPRTT